MRYRPKTDRWVEAKFAALLIAMVGILSWAIPTLTVWLFP